MVIALSIVPPKGINTAGRIWPHSGYLGLTPVSVSGVVRTKIDPDAPSSSTFSMYHSGSAITVSLRCYESRLGRMGITRTNVLYEQDIVLWSAPHSSVTTANGVVTSSGSGYHADSGGISNSKTTVRVAGIPQGDLPFNILLPPGESTGFSTCHLQSYRVFWRLEATVHHGPSPGIGPKVTKHYDVALIRYDMPSCTPTCSSLTSTMSTMPSLSLSLPFNRNHYSSCLPRDHPSLSFYTLAAPPHPLGPSEPFPVSYSLTCKPGVVPTKIQTSIKRVIELFEVVPTQNSTHDGARSGTYGSPSSSPVFVPLSSGPGTGIAPAAVGSGVTTDEDDYTPLSDSDPEDKKEGSGARFIRVPFSSSSSSSSSASSSSKGKEKQAGSESRGGKVKSSRQTLCCTTSFVTRMPGSGGDGGGGGSGLNTFEHEVMVQIPEQKSSSHWAVGCTMRTGMVSVRFVLSAKITFVSSNGGSSSDIVKLADHEFIVGAVNDSERQRVVAQVRAKGYTIPGSSISSTSAVTSGEGDGGTIISSSSSSGSTITVGRSSSTSLLLTAGVRRGRTPTPTQSAIDGITNPSSSIGATARSLPTSSYLSAATVTSAPSVPTSTLSPPISTTSRLKGPFLSLFERLNGGNPEANLTPSGPVSTTLRPGGNLRVSCSSYGSSSSMSSSSSSSIPASNNRNKNGGGAGVNGGFRAGDGGGAATVRGYSVGRSNNKLRRPMTSSGVTTPDSASSSSSSLAAAMMTVGDFPPTTATCNPLSPSMLVHRAGVDRKLSHDFSSLSSSTLSLDLAPTTPASSLASSCPTSSLFDCSSPFFSSPLAAVAISSSTSQSQSLPTLPLPPLPPIRNDFQVQPSKLKGNVVVAGMGSDHMKEWKRESDKIVKSGRRRSLGIITGRGGRRTTLAGVE